MAELVLLETRGPSLPMRLAGNHWHFAEAPVPATSRVRADFLPTWDKVAGQPVLTMEPYAFPAVRDLFYIAPPGHLSRSEWGLVADLANSLHARTHLIAQKELWPKVAKTWYEPPTEVVVAELKPDTALWVEFFATPESKPVITIVASNLAPQFDEIAETAEQLAQAGHDVVLFVAEAAAPEFMRLAALPETAQAKRLISQRVWGE